MDSVRLLGLIQDLAMVLWAGGLCYIAFILPPLPRQDVLPPVFVRILGMRRFRTVNLVCLAILLITAGLAPLAIGMKPAGWPLLAQMLKLLLLLACVVSSVQLNGFLASALAEDQTRPVPAICDEDPTRVDKLLRQINNVSRSLAVFALAFVILQSLS